MKHRIVSVNGVNIDNLRLGRIIDAPLPSEELTEFLQNDFQGFFHTDEVIVYFDILDILFYNEENKAELAENLKTTFNTDVKQYNFIIFKEEYIIKYPDLMSSLNWSWPIYSIDDLKMLSFTLKKYPQINMKNLILMKKFLISDMTRIQTYATDKYNIINLGLEKVDYAKINFI